MKKVLAVFLAAVMMISTLGIIGFAVDAKGFTLDDAFAKANAYASGGKSPTVLIFDTGSVNLGTVPQGAAYKITEGAYTGCHAVIISTAFPENYVQLPYTSNAGDGQAANWMLLTKFNDETVPEKIIQGELFKIPASMADKNATGNTDNIIVFRAVTTANETTPVINKIFTVFYKIIKVLISDDLANQFYNVLKELGIELDVDLTA